MIIHQNLPEISKTPQKLICLVNIWDMNYIWHILGIKLNELTKIKCRELNVDFNIQGYKIAL